MLFRSVRCSSGTYIRALARDLGEALGVGGHLTALRRTAAGTFTLEDAIPLPSDDQRVQVTPLTTVLEREYHVVRLNAEQSGRVRHGMRIPATDAAGGLCGLIADDGQLIALSEAVDGVWKHHAVFNEMV